MKNLILEILEDKQHSYFEYHETPPTTDLLDTHLRGEQLSAQAVAGMRNTHHIPFDEDAPDREHAYGSFPVPADITKHYDVRVGSTVHKGYGIEHPTVDHYFNHFQQKLNAGRKIEGPYSWVPALEDYQMRVMGSIHPYLGGAKYVSGITLHNERGVKTFLHFRHPEKNTDIVHAIIPRNYEFNGEGYEEDGAANVPHGTVLPIGDHQVSSKHYGIQLDHPYELMDRTDRHLKRLLNDPAHDT